jgi:predicted TIM-barrel fold metal-dependent hydrolase
MLVIDSHVHFPTEKTIDDGREGADFGGIIPSASSPKERQKHPWLAEEQQRWKNAWRFPEAEKLDKEEAFKRWQGEYRSRPFLKKIVFVTAGGNDYAAELQQRDLEHFVSYAHHDPLLPDAAERLEKALGPMGLKGYKLLGPTISVPLNDKCFYPLWEIAQDKEVPVLIHFGILGGAGGVANHVNINPLIIHDVAKDFPNLPIIVPHLGCGYVFETLNLCWGCPNVFVDTSGSNQWMRWVPYELNLDILFRKYRETIGSGRILFGTDSSWFPRGFSEIYLDEQVRSMVYVGYSEYELDAVLYRNAAMLLKINE